MELRGVVICCIIALQFYECLAVSDFAFVKFNSMKIPSMSSGGFALKPEDVAVNFPLASKTIYQVCMPQNANSSVVWLKGNNKLANSDRVSMTHVSNAKKISVKEAKLRVKEARLSYKNGTKPKIHILAITNPKPADSGEYACSVITAGSAPVFAKFQVEVSDQCVSGEYMCVKDSKCLKEMQLCNGIAECSDSFDESEESGCGQPLVPANLRMESATSTFIDAIKLRWDKVPAATSYQLVGKLEGNEVANVIVSNAYPGREIGGLDEGTEYSFKVRSKTRAGFGEFSDPVVFSTLALGPPGPVMNMTVDWPQGNLTEYVIEWKRPVVFSNHPRSSIVYSLEYCQLVVVPDEEEEINNGTEAAPESTDAPIEATDAPVQAATSVLNVRNRRQASDNDDDIDNDTAPAGNSSAALDEEEPIKEIKPIVYEKQDCNTVSLGSALTKSLDINVTEDTLYSFEIITIGLKNIRGESSTVRFVIMPPTTYIPAVTEFTHFANDGISGVLIFGLVTGGLVVVVMVAFIVAYACKWSIVQDDLDMGGSGDLEDEKELTPADKKYEKLPTIQQQYDNYKADS